MAGWWGEIARVVTPSAASLSIIGGAPTLAITQDRFVTPTAAALTVTGGVPAVTASNHKTITPTGAALSLTGATPTVSVGVTAAPSGATLAITGGTPTITVVAPSVTFDAVGAGSAVNSVTSLSWSHTATAGAYVIVDVVVFHNRTISGITYGGSAMTLLGTQNVNNDVNSGVQWKYGRASVAGGAQTVSITFSSSTNAAGNSLSYTGVSSVGSASTAFGTTFSAAFTQNVTCSAGQRIVHAFGVNSGFDSAISGISGGTNRSNVGTVNTRISISDATATTTFSATAGPGTIVWSGVAVVLSP